MAGVTQLVSSVSGGDQKAFGAASVENSALGASPPSIVSWHIGAARTADPSRSGWLLNLALAPHDSDPGLLHFTPGLRPITSVGGLDSAGIGSHAAGNTADAIAPGGIPPEGFAPTLVARPGAILSLNLSAAPRNTVALQMSWGSDLLTSAGGSDTQAFGLLDIDTHLSANPVGFDAQDFGFGRVFSGAAGNLSFNFDSVWPRQEVAISFTFGGPLLLMQAGADSAQFGLPELVLPDAAHPPGTDALNVGLARVYNASLVGGNIVLNLTEVKTQSGANVAMTFGEAGNKNVKPQGWDSAHLGDASLVDNKRVNPPSVTPNVIGSHDVSHFIREVVPSPLISLRVGVGVEVENLSKGILGITIGSQLRMEPADTANDRMTVTNRTRYVSAGSSAPRNGYGVPRVEHDARYLHGAGAVMATGYGGHWASHSPRSVIAGGIWPPEPIHNHIVGFQREVEPRGWDSQAFGTRIKPDPQSAYPAGFSGAPGSPAVWNWDTHIRLAHQAPHTQFGAWEVWNLRQIIVPFFEENKEYWSTVSPKNAIVNRNRVLGAVGTRMDKFGYTDIRLGARVLHPSGLDTFDTAKWYEPMTMAAYRIRAVLFSGWDSFTTSRYHGAINAARSLRPGGWGAMALGGHKVWKPDRTFYQISAGDQQGIGRAFIADAVREITLERHHAIPLPYQSTPQVALWSRYVSVGGMESLKISTPGVREQRNILKTTWGYDPIHWHGYPTIRNLTPELRSWPFDASQFGQQMIRTQWRTLEAEGSRMDQHGKSTIRDRRTWTTPTGIAPIVVMPGPQVFTFGGAPKKQFIEVPNWWMSEIQRAQQVPKPSLNWRTLEPEGFDSSQVGSQHDVWAGGIEVGAGIYELTVGEPDVSLSIRTLAPKSIAVEPEYTRHDKPRLTPHTIYSVVEAPQQAKTNHPVANLHYVNSFSTPGNPKIDLRNRRIVIGDIYGGIGAPALGQPDIYLRVRRVLPSSLKPMRMGVLVVGPSDQEVEQYGGASGAAVGAPTIVRPPYTGPRTITAHGSDFSSFAKTSRVSNWIQERPLQGFDALKFGESKEPDTQYMWQTLHVGPPEHPPMQGFDSMKIGGGWISHWVREVQPEGADAFLCEYDPLKFKERMRVWRIEEEPEAIRVSVPGIDVSDRGMPDVRPTVHRILPDGNAEQYRKGAP